MNTADDFNDGTSKTLPAAFPEGYNAFYMMKYDISQGQWRDFLNTLTRTQQNSLIYQGGNGPNYTGVSSISLNVFAWANSTSAQSRNGVEITAISSSSAPMTFSCNLNGTVNGSNDGEWIAMNYLSWMDGAAYAAWAGLRPYTELEFEKASRGPSSVDTGVNGEYAWGSATILQATSINNSGQNSEVAGQTGSGLCVYGSAGSVQGPMRCGMAAANSTTRAQAGASYWGILDLSGNVWKRPVTVGNSTGRTFTGTNGTGLLASDGNATNSDWPGYSAGEVSGATGCCFRGGAWISGFTLERVSDRDNAAYVDTNRGSSYGARFARTSP
jgi:formylglycine-generating enzyme required for sulfatase activity